MIELQQAVDYLEYLFNSTKQYYSSSRTKIARLLAIAVFKYARENKILFESTISKHSNFGCIMEDIAWCMSREFYTQIQYYDKEIVIMLPYDFKDNKEIIKNDEIRNLIKDVFINFGAYSAKDLNKYIKTLIQLNGMTDKNDDVLLYNFLILDKQLFYKYPTNKVIEYIFG